MTARQAMGALELTLPKAGGSGTWNVSDVKVFMKDLGDVASGGYVLLPAFRFRLNFG